MNPVPQIIDPLALLSASVTGINIGPVPVTEKVASAPDFTQLLFEGLSSNKAGQSVSLMDTEKPQGNSPALFQNPIPVSIIPETMTPLFIAPALMPASSGGNGSVPEELLFDGLAMISPNPEAGEAQLLQGLDNAVSAPLVPMFAGNCFETADGPLVSKQNGTKPIMKNLSLTSQQNLGKISPQQYNVGRFLGLSESGMITPDLKSVPTDQVSRGFIFRTDTLPLHENPQAPMLSIVDEGLKIKEVNITTIDSGAANFAKANNSEVNINQSNIIEANPDDRSMNKGVIPKGVLFLNDKSVITGLMQVPSNDTVPISLNIRKGCNLSPQGVAVSEGKTAPPEGVISEVTAPESAANTLNQNREFLELTEPVIKGSPAVTGTDKAVIMPAVKGMPIADNTPTSEMTAVRFVLPPEVRETDLKQGRTIIIKMEPEHLGNVRLTLTSRHDSITGRLVVENSAARAVVETNLDKLYDQLARQGIRLDAFQVSLSGEHAGNRFAHSRSAGDLKARGRNGKEYDSPGESLNRSENISRNRMYITAAGVNWVI